MKIAVIGCFYGSADLLPRVLAPWVELRRAGAPIVLMGINAQFKEYADLGYSNDDHETRAVLEAHRADFDHLVIEAKPLQEHEVRNQLLELSRAHGVDAIWLLDGDELYTREQIEAILAYCEKVPEFDYYHIHFQNIILDTIHSRDPFLPPRIVRTDRNEGITSFVWDNEIEFGNGKTLYDLIPGIVPRRVAYVEHRTWRRKDAQKKIAYSEKHFGFSIFKIAPETGEIVYNTEWFNFYSQPAPKYYDDGSVGTPMPSYEVRLVVRYDQSEEEALRALWSLVRALLVFEHANEVDLSLSVCLDAAYAARNHVIQEFLELFSLAPKYYSSVSGEVFTAASQDLLFFTDSATLHSKNALCHQFLSYRHFSRMMGHGQFAMGLFDDAALYENAPLTRIVRGTGSHWRTVPQISLAGSLVPRELLRQVAREVELFKKSETVLRTLGRFFAFTPLPALAVSLQGSRSPFVSNDTYWDELASYPRGKNYD